MARKTGVYGDRELAKALNDLAKGLPLKDVDAAAEESMKPMLDDARMRAMAHRNFTGKYPGFPQPRAGRQHVDQGLKIRKTKSTKTRRSYWLGATGRAIRILHLLEFGVAPHWQPRFRGGFLHPGARANPALTPAYEEHSDEVPKSFGTALWRILERRVNQVRKL